MDDEQHQDEGPQGDAAPEWDESFYRFVDQIERGEWPIQIPCAIELSTEGGRPRVRVKRNVSPDEQGTPERPLLRVNVRMDQAKMREILLERIAEGEKQGVSKLVGLMVMARIDREFFFESAANYFAQRLADGDDGLGDEAALAEFIVDLHERGPELIVEVVARTIAANRPAGERLRSAILEALDEPRCRDELGMLATAELGQRLEE